MTDDKSHKGKLTISRMNSNRGADTIRIQIADATNNDVLFEVRLSVEALGYALTGLSMQSCTFDFYDLDTVGKRKEFKDVFLTFEMDDAPKYEVIMAAARIHETDGWHCTLTEMTRINQSNVNGVWYVQAPFMRYVDESAN